jgi:hypothetical protein
MSTVSVAHETAKARSVGAKAVGAAMPKVGGYPADESVGEVSTCGWKIDTGGEQDASLVGELVHGASSAPEAESCKGS